MISRSVVMNKCIRNSDFSVIHSVHVDVSYYNQGNAKITVPYTFIIHRHLALLFSIQQLWLKYKSNQRLTKPLNIDFHVRIFLNFCLPYWIRHFELQIFYFRFENSDQKRLHNMLLYSVAMCQTREDIAHCRTCGLLLNSITSE